MKKINVYADETQSKLYKKFPSTHFLSNPDNVHHVFLWNTFFRRNLHRLAIDYLKINLYPYQALMLYLMGICHFIVVIACRAAAKSFIIALYSCCRCITRPYTKIVLTSSTKGQSKLIVSDKIQGELMNMSPMLRREISRIKDNQNEVVVYFRDKSTITVVPASDNGRGHRSHCCIREEFRQIDKTVEDSVLSPFQTVRQAPYMLREPYCSMKELQEEPVNIYISSSWVDAGHWMWDIVDQAYDGMMNGEQSCLLAFDESITLKHNIRTMNQMRQEHKKLDSLTWRIEYLNERVKENTHAFFDYKMLAQNQNLKKPFYPQNFLQYKNQRENKYNIPKQTGEIRIVACDMAFIENKNNDNSVFSCMRLLPESKKYEKTDNSSVEVKQGYIRSVPYIESVQGGDTDKQAIRIRELYEDFQADYIVLDLRNAGISIYDKLAKVMYDEERDCEYSPLTCINDQNIANRIIIDGAKPSIFVINASQKLNSDIALAMRNTLENKQIDLLVNYNEAKEEILPKFKKYRQAVDIDTQLFYEQPFLETQILISEMTGLVYKTNDQTGTITIHEQGTNRKDHYTSISYGNWFASLLEKDLLSQESDYDFVISYS